MDKAHPNLSSAETVKLYAAFIAVYLIWGSTYLAMRVAIETLPPLLMAGTRFLLAGAALYLWSLPRSGERPTPTHWRSAMGVGGLLLLGGNGAVVWAEQRVPSGLTALMVSMTPLWMVLLEWLRPGGLRPGSKVVAGLAAGFGGILLLVGPGEWGGSHVDPIGAVALLIATVSWAAGSLYSRHAPLPSSPLLATAMEMLAGGLLLTLAGTALGEWNALHLAAVSLRSFSAYIYLIVFGSLLGFSSYIYLLKHTTVARASTYAYVNPVVAIVLGWLILHEAITPRTLISAGIIIAAVFAISMYRPSAEESVNKEAASTDLS